VISHSFAFSASRRLKFSYKSILPCTAFPSTLLSMLELSPSLLSLLLLRVERRSRLNTRAILALRPCACAFDNAVVVLRKTSLAKSELKMQARISRNSVGIGVI
jgi:hypothetical protein